MRRSKRGLPRAPRPFDSRRPFVSDPEWFAQHPTHRIRVRRFHKSDVLSAGERHQAAETGWWVFAHANSERVVQYVALSVWPPAERPREARRRLMAQIRHHAAQCFGAPPRSGQREVGA